MPSFILTPGFEKDTIFGAAIAGYHYLLQLGWLPSLICEAVGYSAGCSQRFVMNFGYITLPLMSFTAFLLLIAISSFVKNKSSQVR